MSAPQIAAEHRRRNSVSALSWEEAESITKGQIGRTIQAICPFCSHLRSKVGRRRKPFAVTLRSPDFAVFNCLHCGEHGYVHPDTPGRVIDFAERQRRRDNSQRKAEQDRHDRAVAALRLWDARQPFRGSPAEDRLLHARGIGDWLDSFPYLDEVFGYLPECPYGGEFLPCMIALIRNIATDEPQGVQLTPLRAGVEPKRRSRGLTAGGAIKISPDHEVHHGLLVGEGVESAFSLSRILSYRPIWSLIDRINLGNFPVLSAIEHLVIAADNDPSGDGLRDAEKTAERWHAARREVDLRIPNEHGDFNDLLPKDEGL